MNNQENKQTENLQEKTVDMQENADVDKGKSLPEQPKKKAKKNRLWLRIIIWIVVIALVVYLTMLLAVGISEELETIPDLINYIKDQFK